MKLTLHYKLRKPQRRIPHEDDAADIEDLNFNSDSTDSILYTHANELERLETDKADKTAVQTAFDIVNAEIALKADVAAVNLSFDLVNASLVQKADSSNMLAKDNVTEYSPTSSYNPATKKYVDDSVQSAGGGDMLKSVYDVNNDGIVDIAESLKGGEW